MELKVLGREETVPTKIPVQEKIPTMAQGT